ncbi:unnamed protein product [Effrenium voratum]|uniref:OTU domain-containing protein n=1 Tax=Effrenium voratum TaxID=2562239 RepID=A0AA36ITA2_9DINO|nr:unnamed protein product [Effrenium voratum]
MPLVRGPVFDLLLLELLELLDGRATLRLLALCRDARRPERAARGAAARRLAEDFAAFLQGARVRLPGFELCDFLEARACWDFNEERANRFRPPAFLAGAFCAGSQFQMRHWIDRYWRLRGLDPMEVLQRLNFFDLLGGPEFDFYLGLLRKGQARFIYSREVDRPGDFRGCLAAGDEDDEEPPFDAGLAIVFRCDHFLTAVCARQARPAQPRKRGGGGEQTARDGEERRGGAACCLSPLLFRRSSGPKPLPASPRMLQTLGQRPRWADVWDSESDEREDDAVGARQAPAAAALSEARADNGALWREVAAFAGATTGPCAYLRLPTLALWQARLRRKCEVQIFVLFLGFVSERRLSRPCRRAVRAWQGRLKAAALDCDFPFPVWRDVVCFDRFRRGRPCIRLSLDRALFAAAGFLSGPPTVAKRKTLRATAGVDRESRAPCLARELANAVAICETLKPSTAPPPSSFLRAGPNYGSFFGQGTAENVAAVCVLAVVGVPGDGNCLFHALAAQDREARCGEELRAELVDFLERKAGDQDGVEEVWREEAEHLRGPPVERWGGAVAISAYSLLRRRRVFVHVKVAGADAAEVWSNSHPLVDADAPVVHLLYDGVGHYNALVEVELSDEMAPAWPQPPPSLCFAPALAEAAGAKAGGVYAKDGAGVAPQSLRDGARRARPGAGAGTRRPAVPPATRAAKELAQELCAWPAPSPRASEAQIAAGRVVGCSLRCAFDRPRPQQDVDMASATAASSNAAAGKAAVICALAVVDVPGDGNCLFHALATQDEVGRCGEELRAELANFLESEAFHQDGFECWGGAVAISAYSLLRQRRVFVHVKVAGSDAAEVQDSSHAVVDADAPVAHLLYNGVDHYSALIEAELSGAMVPAWPQPPPPRCFAPAITEAAGATAAAVYAEDCVRLRAENKGSTSRPGRGLGRAPRPAQPAPTKSRRRLWEKTTPAPELQDDVMEEVGKAFVIPAAQTSHPFRPLEDAVTELALKLRLQPTLPPGADEAELKDGAVWPRTFCTFDGCGWEAADGLEADLARHLETEHAEDLQPIAACLLRPRCPDALSSVYSEAVAQRCRADAPLAGCSLDRTALRSFAKATAKDSVEALICFCCACVYTCVAEVGERSEIQWRRPLSRAPSGELLFFGRPAAAAAEVLGLEHFLNKYDQLNGPGKKLSDHETFASWKLRLPGPDDVELLCCPEDHRCGAAPEHVAEGVLCEHCELPVCGECLDHLAEAELPPLSLANDMWTGYAPERIYTEEATVMELICASPCVTTLICMSMEARFRSEAGALDEAAHMARHRFGARGNALSFPLPWEDVLQAGGDRAAALPRSGAELGQLVVVNLVLDMKRLGHPSFAGADEEGVRLRAAALPTDGAPPEVLKVVAQVDADFDDAEDKSQPQKAATPCDGRQEDVAAAGATFAAQRARAVVAEGCAEEDASQAAAAALKKLREELATEAELRSMEKLEVRAGNQLVDQFQPLYFATSGTLQRARKKKKGAAAGARGAATGGEEKSKGRRRAPRVNIRAWAAAMQRRVEAQFRRDWTFGFAVWNYLFRTAVNLQKNAYMFSAPNADGGGYHSLKPEEIVAGAQELARRLNGTYTDVNGGEKPVRGDLTKLRFANLQPAARKILANVEARAANIPGTHEVRKTMRLQTHAYHTALMLRLARVREEDPALLRDGAKRFQARGAPALDEEFCRLSPEALAESLPNYEDRRALLARDPLACAEGFRTLVLLTLRHLLGVRFCPHCPNCAASERPCSDAFGSNALATGGVLGRVDAVFGSIECQKSGALHAHMQVFVQCRHQRDSLASLLDLGKPKIQTLLQRYASYTAHVRRSVYCDPDGWERDRAAVEEEWPEHKDCALMLSRPAYQASRRLRPEEWTRRYLAEDVEQLQRRKQHHAASGGLWLTAATPRTRRGVRAASPQLILGRTALVCRGLAEQLDLPVKGKRSSLGLQWPVNDPNLNGNHPALLAALRCNGDLQVPYRFPVTKETHDDALCQEEACVGDGDVKLLVREAQRTQAAQAGYGCDYMNKRLPIAVHELKEWQKGQRELGKELKDKPAGYVGARVAKRLTTDCYARGVCRGAVECANLTTRAAANDPTAAESVKTATVHPISLRFGFQLLDAAAAGEAWPTEPQHLRTDLRPRARQGRVVSCPFWTFYGARGRAAQVYELCAFEFARHFRFQQAKRPFTLAPMMGELSGYHAALTHAGAAKLDRSARANLQPGVDYKIREEGGEDWLPLGHGALAQKFRHDWVLVPRSRPHVPVVQGALGGRSEVDYARCVLLLFCLWTTHPDDASAAVPYLGDLCKLGETDWRRALRRRLILRGFPTEEVKLFALNFCFVYCLPRELRPDQHLQENSDNEVQDEPVFFDKEDGEVEDEAAATRLCVMTKQMFDLSRAAWKTGGAASASPGPRRAQPGPARPEDEELDHDAIAQAARASRGKSRLPLLPGIGVAPQDPEAQPLGPRVTADGLLGWLGSEHVQSGLNAKQLELLRVVVERVLVELELVPPDHEIALRRAEPLAWLLHGPPGAGKSHVLKFLRELFEEQLGYAQGIDYEVAAFQAVNAADIRGRTLHNACGLGVDAAALDRAVSQEAAKRMSYWRWLVVDEISMVNARLLAQAHENGTVSLVEQRLRAAVPSASQWKRGVAGESRPFAGVNVLLLGDFYQLPPPSGGYLADVPSSRRPPRLSTAADAEPDLLADYGRNLVWGGALQGVTELEERKRKDDWWNEVENWRYLHGKPVEGCRLTAAERKSRRRVIAGPGDPRLGDEKFRWAAAIVANNDAKYQINKDRAEDYSRAAESPLRWSVALDAPSAEVLQTQECDKAARIRWLQYHDRDTENLSGMLPLAVGMRVVLADHLDRSEDKLLLRGSAGRVHSWVWQENDLRPTCVYVKFDGATWQLDRAPEPGLYPVYPARKVWKLDAKRKKPVLKIARTQLPLAPAYAITAHDGSQGKTLPAALVEFNVDKRTDVTFGTVAASRVRSREDVLILRPFERWLYTRGAPEGPALLLQQLRGEEVDWGAFRETKAPSAACEKCKETKTLDYFSDRQWERVRANRSAICLACGPGKGGQKTLKRKLPSGLARLDCRGCKSRKLEDAFPRAQLQQDESEAKRRCLKCLKEVRALNCSVCLGEKPLSEFNSAMATMPWAAVCGPCGKSARQQPKPGRAGWFACRTCETFLPPQGAARGEASGQRRRCLIAPPAVPGRRIATLVANAGSSGSRGKPWARIASGAAQRAGPSDCGAQREQKWASLGGRICGSRVWHFGL